MNREVIESKNFALVTHVDQTWNSLLKGLEQIDNAFDDLEIGGGKQ